MRIIQVGKKVGSFTLLAAVAAGGTALAAPQLNPNSQRYAQKNPSAATGRSGTASLEARSLLGKDGKTVIDVTTGTIDGTATAPGYIAKVQFKAYRSDETVAFTQNYSGMTTPTQQYTFSAMLRGQALQVQGNIRGIDGKRTDIVTVSDTVRLRPDLGVGVNAPTKAKIDTIVGITGSIVEANGDTGATTDCVLYVDDVEADRTNGIWVDSGDTVSCAFNYKFATLGSHTVKVAAANVKPADWDTANNSASAIIEIVAAETKMNYWFQAWDNSYVNAYTSTGNYRYTDGTYSATNDWGYVYDYRQNYNGVYISTWTSTAVGFPLTVTAQESSDGVAGALNTVTVAAPDYGYGCTYRYIDGGYGYVYVCSYDGYSWSSYQRYGGKVTYFSKNWSYYWDSNGGSYQWSYNYSGDSTWGSFGGNFGSTVKLDYKIDAANGTFTAAPETSLSDYGYYYWWYGYNQPVTCSESTSSYYTSNYCWGGEYSYTYRYGYASDYSNP